MKLDFDDNPAQLTISSYGAGWIRIGEQRLERPCVVSPQGVMTDLLPAEATGLARDHVERLAALGADIVLLGTGAKQRFVDYALVQMLAERGIGLEVMDTGAACRSFNVLVAEGRAVAAALYMI